MALWMAYALLMTTLLGLAAAGLESALRAWRLPARWAVAGGILASVLVPLLSLARPAGVATDAAGTLGRGIQVAVVELVRPGFLSALDRPLLAFWVLSAMGACAVAAAIHLRLRRLVHGSPQDSFEGIPYRRTPDFGPAVVGFLAGVIVLPSWATALDGEALRLALRHEREHLRARDPALQLGGLLFAALQPWNVALWWQFRRLRHAIELDCDGRLLRSGVDLRAYADLLCAVVASRRSLAGVALTLGAPRSRLAWRVERLAELVGRRRMGRAAVSTAAATLIAAAALQLPLPHTAPVAAHVGVARAVVKLDLRGDPARPDSLVTLRLEGADAVRAVRGVPGTLERDADGRVVRRIIRTAPPPGH